MMNETNDSEVLMLVNSWLRQADIWAEGRLANGMAFKGQEEHEVWVRFAKIQDEPWWFPFTDGRVALRETIAKEVIKTMASNADPNVKEKALPNLWICTACYGKRGDEEGKKEELDFVVRDYRVPIYRHFYNETTNTTSGETVNLVGSISPSSSTLSLADS